MQVPPIADETAFFQKQLHKIRVTFHTIPHYEAESMPPILQMSHNLRSPVHNMPLIVLPADNFSDDIYHQNPLLHFGCCPPSASEKHFQAAVCHRMLHRIHSLYIPGSMHPAFLPCVWFHPLTAAYSEAQRRGPYPVLADPGMQRDHKCHILPAHRPALILPAYLRFPLLKSALYLLVFESELPSAARSDKRPTSLFVWKSAAADPGRHFAFLLFYPSKAAAGIPACIPHPDPPKIPAACCAACSV